MTMDVFIFSIYCCVLLIIGLFSYKRLKTSQNDYHLCGKSLGRVTTSLSLSSAVLSGSGLVGGVALIYQIGVAGVFWNLAAVPAWFIVGFTITVTLRKKEIDTIPSFMAQHYGHYTQKLITTLQVIESIIYIGVQIIVAALAIKTLLGVTILTASIIMTMLLVAYALLGGMWAVVWGGVFQYFILMTVVIAGCAVAVYKAGGLQHVYLGLPKDHLDIGALGTLTPIAWFMLCVYSWATEQAYMQRAFAAKNEKTARFAYIFCGFNSTVFALAVCGIGLAASLILPEIKDSQLAFTTLIEIIFPSYLRGFFLVGIVAMAVSTSSTFLSASTTIIMQDLFPSIYRFFSRMFGKTIRHDLDQKTKLLLSRIIILILAGASLTTAVCVGGIVEMVVFCTLIAPAAVFVPFLFALYAKDKNKYAGFFSILTAALSGAMAQLTLYEKVPGFFGYFHPLLLGPCVGLLCFITIKFLFLFKRKKQVDGVHDLPWDLTVGEMQIVETSLKE